MNAPLPSSAASQDLFHSRGWLIAGGVLSVFVGMAAIGSPLLFSLVIAQFIGAFALVSGVISLGLAIFGKHAGHRVLDTLLALIRIAAGIVLLVCAASSVAVITLIIAIFLIVEGVSVIFASFKLRGHTGWGWTLVNGVAALVLGVMVYARWPSDSAWVLGLLFGINAIFSGASLLALGMAARPQQPA